MTKHLTGYLQPAALGLLLLGASLASATAATTTSASPPPAAASPIGADQRPTVLAQVPEVRIQLDGDRDHERDRHMDRRDHDPAIVVVPRRDHDTTGADHDERRDRDHDRRDRD